MSRTTGEVTGAHVKNMPHVTDEYWEIPSVALHMYPAADITSMLTQACYLSGGKTYLGIETV